MCWQCDNPNGTTEEYLDELRETIRIHGWAVQGVDDDPRPYAYTIGLHDHGLPELMVTGLTQQRAARVLNDVAEAAVRGRVLKPGAHIAVGVGPLLEIVEVDHPDAHMNFAIALGGPGIRALQLVWADDRGRWPWGRGGVTAVVDNPCWACGLRRRTGGTAPCSAARAAASWP
jgi:Domain of unknown function (DUF4262)